MLLTPPARVASLSTALPLTNLRALGRPTGWLSKHDTGRKTVRDGRDGGRQKRKHWGERETRHLLLKWLCFYQWLILLQQINAGSSALLFFLELAPVLLLFLDSEPMQAFGWKGIILAWFPFLFSKHRVELRSLTTAVIKNSEMRARTGKDVVIFFLEGKTEHFYVLMSGVWLPMRPLIRKMSPLPVLRFSLDERVLSLRMCRGNSAQSFLL